MVFAVLGILAFLKRFIPTCYPSIQPSTQRRRLRCPAVRAEFGVPVAPAVPVVHTFDLAFGTFGFAFDPAFVSVVESV